MLIEVVQSLTAVLETSSNLGMLRLESPCSQVFVLIRAMTA